jgi:hypothetical protein
MTNQPIDVFKTIEMRGPDECWPWTGAWGGRERDRRPYFMANGRRTMAYRWVWELVEGTPIPPDQMILHSCDNGGYPIGCCNRRHMRLGTVQDNSDDMTSRQRVGLPHTVVRAIRRLLDQGMAQQDVAARYALSRETVSAIATGRTYKDVQ